MEKLLTYVDIGFKLFLAGIAGWSAYIFGFQKQQNDDIKLIADMVSSDKQSQRMVGMALARAYAEKTSSSWLPFVEGSRIPPGVFTAFVDALNEQSDKKVRDFANAGAAQVSLRADPRSFDS